MARDASGTFTSPSNSWNPAVEGTTIDETDFNSLRTEIEDGLSESVFTGGSSGTDNKIVRADGTSGKKVQESNAATLDDSDNLENLNNIGMAGYLDVAEISTPANPSANSIRVYAVDNAGTSELHFVDASGNDTNLSVLDGTVTSVDVTQPAAGITTSGGPITGSGAVTLALANDLAALEGLASTGLAARTAADTWAQRTLTAPAAGLSISNANGVSGNPTFALANDLSALEGLTGTGFAVRTGSDTWAEREFAAPAAGFTISNQDGVAGNITFTLADDLAALEALASTGIAARTAADTWAQRTLTAPAAGLSISNANGVSGNPTFALANDLAALEGLAANGFAVRTAADTWAQRVITGGDGIAISNGSGVSGNPSVAVDIGSLTDRPSFGSGAKMFVEVGGSTYKFDYDDLPGAGAGVSNAFANVTDGTTTAAASGADTFKLRVGTGLDVTVTNDDVTHGDNALFEISGLDDGQVAAAVSATNYTPSASTVEGHLSGIDTALGALDDADIAAVASQTNYTPASATVDGHFEGIDTELGALDTAKANLSGATFTGNIVTSSAEIRSDTYATAAGIAVDTTKAWGHWEGSDATLDDSFNVASLTDAGVGNFRPQIDNNMGNTNYSASSDGETALNTTSASGARATGQAAGQITIQTWSNAALADIDNTVFAVWGDLA